MRSVLVVVLFASVGCDAGPERDFVARSGRLCAFDGGSQTDWLSQDFRARDPIRFELAATPKTNECPLEVIADCRVELGSHPQELVVDAWVAWNENPGASCSRELHSARATCESPKLLADTYTIVFADQRMVLRVPSTTSEPPCMDQP